MPPPGRRRQRGLTLVEVLVAMGLSSLIALALLAMTQVHGNLQRRQQQQIRALDQARAVIAEVTAALRPAGGPVFSGVVPSAVPPAMPRALPVVNVRNGAGAAGDDALEIISSDALPAATLLAEINPGDAKTLWVNQAAGLKVGDLFFLTDLNDGVLYRLAASPTGGTLAGMTVVGLPVSPPPAPPPVDFFQGAHIFRARAIAYRIDTQVLGGTPALVLEDGAPLQPGATPQLVAEDIADLQVALAVDGIRNGTVDGAVSEVGAATDDDEWVYNYPGEALPSPLPPNVRIAAVRVTVVARKPN
jgi:prepilin-type N-terminal cleavage/methylation domain-containing protein